MKDYLIHYNHNHDALGRFASSAGSAGRAIGSKFTSGKKEKSNSIRKYESSQRIAKKKNASEAAINKSRQKGSKSNNTKLSDSERKRLVSSGSVQEVTKNKDKLSNRELETAINRLQKERTNRIDLEMKLSDLNSPTGNKNKESAMQKVERLGKNAETLANAINSGTKLYNNAAMVYNLGKPANKQLPRIGDKKGGEDKPRPFVQNIINSGDAAKAAKYVKRMTPDERKKVIDAIQDTNKINELAGSGNKGGSSSNESSKNTNKTQSDSVNYKSYFNEKQTTSKPESWADVRKEMAPKADAASKKKANDILDKYPSYPTGTSQKKVNEKVAEVQNVPVEDIKKKKPYGKVMRED